jgi:hypothetical protein
MPANVLELLEKKKLNGRCPDVDLLRCYRRDHPLLEKILKSKVSTFVINLCRLLTFIAYVSVCAKVRCPERQQEFFVPAVVVFSFSFPLMYDSHIKA